MKRLLLGLSAATVLVIAGCKERIAPHVTPELDPEVLVAESLAADKSRQAPQAGNPAQAKVITLTVNNAPGPDQSIEQDILQQTVDLFQKRHPNVRIQFSPWRFTPESFLDRAQSRALTDIVHVDSSQVPPILDMSLAADLTELAATAPQLQEINPELMDLVSRNGRVYGVPSEMHTMALFYNRRLVDAALKPPAEKGTKTSGKEKKSASGKEGEPPPANSRETAIPDAEATTGTDSAEDAESLETPATSSTKKKPSPRRNRSSETEEGGETETPASEREGENTRPSRRQRESDTSGRRRSQGADEEPRGFLTDTPAFDVRPESLLARYGFAVPEKAQLEPERVLAQYQPGVYYADPYAQEAPPPRSSRRRSQQQPAPQQQYYGYPQQQYSQPQEPAPRARRGFFGWWGREQEQAPESRPADRYAPAQYDPYDPESTGRRAPVEGELYNVEPTPTPKSRRTTASDRESTKAREQRLAQLNEDVLTTDPVEMTTETQTQAKAKGTTVVETAALPQDWDSFIRLAVKLTDHSTTPTYGYAPILFAREGGREFSQWAIQAGLQIEIPNGDTATLDVNTTSAAMVAQFLKDLHWRYDVTPPPADSYADKLIQMFAQGRIAMMMLPADQATITRLLRLGFPVEELGIAPLPSGPDNRKHLAFGSCYIVNSQLGHEERAAAFQWLLFQLDPEVIRLRKTMAFRELDWAGVPSVPLFRAEKHQQLVESLRTYYTLPLFPDYERTVAENVMLEPPYYTERLYEAIAEGVRPIVENKDSDPLQAIVFVGTDFEKKYLRNNDQTDGIRRYLSKIPGLR